LNYPAYLTLVPTLPRGNATPFQRRSIGTRRQQKHGNEVASFNRDGWRNCI